MPGLSVIIPTCQEAATIAAAVRVARDLGHAVEVIVVDGGSTDDTAGIAFRAGAKVVSSAKGRGIQMHTGAMEATGDVFFFLHADTSSPPNALNLIEQALTDPDTVGGSFQVIFDGNFASAKFLTWLYHYLAWIGLRYGDSGYFARRTSYFNAGGFNPYPIFEDLDLMRRLKKQGRFVRINAAVTTSSRRFMGRWFWRVFARWTFLQTLYWMGVSPERLGRFYYPPPKAMSGSRNEPRLNAKEADAAV